MKRCKVTLEILHELLNDPILAQELEEHAGYVLPEEVPSKAVEAVRLSVRQLFGPEAIRGVEARLRRGRNGGQRGQNRSKEV